MAGGDVKLRLTPGESMPVTTPGDYIFLKFADREIRVTVTEGQGVQKPVVMRAGDKYRPGPFRALNIENTDLSRPAKVVFVIGEGDFNRQIIQGEISAQLKIRSADGEFIDDTRQKLTVDLIPVPGSGITENYGQVIKTIIPGGTPDIQQGLVTIDYNPKVHKMPIATVGIQGHLKMFEYNPVTNEAGRVLGYLPDGVGEQSEGGSAYGNTLYNLDTYGDQGIYKSVGGGPWQKIAGASSANDIAIYDDGSLFVIDNRRVRRLTPDGGEIASVAVSQWAKRITLLQGRLWVLGSSSFDPRVFDENLNLIETKPQWPADGRMPHVGYGPYMLEMYRNASRKLEKVRVRAPETVVDLLAGKGYRACEFATLTARPQSLEAVRSTASVIVTEAETGTPTVNGELIKLALEWLKGQPVNSEYLDYVHGVKITGATDQAGNRYPVQSIQSDGASFLAAGIEDDFTAIFPATIELTVDNRAGL